VKFPNVGYHWARAEGRAIRAGYTAALATITPGSVNVPREVPFDLCSYSGAAMLPEQVASIRSFLRHAGRPRRFTVYSDGSHSAREQELLRRLDRSVEVAPVPKLAIDVTGSIAAYLDEHPTGRQLRLMMSLPIERPTFYVDSDVLFFAGAANIDALLATSALALYLRDCQLSADERVLRSADEYEEPVNIGMIFFREKLEWSLALQRLRELHGEPNFHTNQTVTHLVLHANRAAALDPEKFVLRLDDQFMHRDRYARPEIAARHYVNPVRHKFWAALLR
jgi:hypothetical protein